MARLMLVNTIAGEMKPYDIDHNCEKVKRNLLLYAANRDCHFLWLHRSGKFICKSSKAIALHTDYSTLHRKLGLDQPISKLFISDSGNPVESFFMDHFPRGVDEEDVLLHKTEIILKDFPTDSECETKYGKPNYVRKVSAQDTKIRELQRENALLRTKLDRIIYAFDD